MPGNGPPAIGLDPTTLRNSKLGLAHVTDSGRLIWTPTTKSYGSYGAAFGYRVLDSVLLPQRTEWH